MNTYKIDLDKSVFELCKEEPRIQEILNEIGFTDIMKPGMLQTAGRFMTLRKGSVMKKIDMSIIKEVFLEHGFEIIE